MSFQITFDLGSLGDGQGELARVAVAAFVEALASLNEQILKVHVAAGLPKLYECKKLRYVDDDGASWRDLVQIMQKRCGNCQSLAAWRLAELRQNGEEASVHLYLMKGSGGRPPRYHVAVRRASGKIEDPTKKFSELKLIEGGRS